MNGYTTTVREASRELTAKERVMFKDTSNCIKLDEATSEGKVILDVDTYVVLDIHNEKADDKDYANYVIVDKNGAKYVTGSEAFWSSFMEIMSEMNGVDEDFKIEVYRKESKNYKGKDFITCSII